MYDTVSTATSLHNIPNLYGNKVAELVDGLSKLTNWFTKVLKKNCTSKNVIGNGQIK